jgi:hypothetical protein
MSDLPPEWDTFAAAWLAKTAVPYKHGESDELYASRQCEMAAQVADRMVLLKAMREQPQVSTQRGPYPQAPRLLHEALGAVAGPAGPSEAPSASALAGQPCWRAYNGKKRSQGEDCVGNYDANGVCTSCKLAYTMPGDPPKPAFSPSYGPAPLPPPSGPPVQIARVAQVPTPQAGDNGMPPMPPPAFTVPPGTAE